MRSLLSLITAAIVAVSVWGCGGETDMRDPYVDDPLADIDGDTILNEDEGSREELDTDLDGTADYRDLDSDGDGLLDAFEAGDEDPMTPPVDSDLDTIPDFQDLDSDDNGIPDETEVIEDTDGDGLEDFRDLDDDNDLVLDVNELSGLPEALADTDGDGAPDIKDPDSDNDNILDGHEHGGGDTGGIDTDGDGLPDWFDLDSDNDTLTDFDEAGDIDIRTPPVDTDRDSVPDFRDLDSDNDGYSDQDEAEGVPQFDFARDDHEGVELDMDGAIVLTSRLFEHPYIWIANTGEGTVSKVDTRTYMEVARYRTGPSGSGNDPSRTSVNTLGDVYIGNRGGRSVTKISGQGSMCPDTNRDGRVTTSSGPADVLAWGMDDCVLWNTSLPDGGVIRAVAAQDIEGLDFTITSNVWIGGYDSVTWKLDGNDGSILLRTASPTRNYGFALDSIGNLYISGRGSGPAIGRIDTTRCTSDASCNAAGVKESIPLGGSYQPYGITVDARNRVWTCNHGSQTISRYDPTLALGSRFHHQNVGVNCHGIAADNAGWVWGAGYGSGIVRLRGDMPSMYTVVAGSTGQSVKGMAVDVDGMIWGINRGHNSAMVVNPGPTLMSGTTMLGVASTIVSPYTYSDMTGQQLRLVVTPRGLYRRVLEGCSDVTSFDTIEWIALAWDADVPPDTTLQWRVRTADTRAGLSSAPWVDVAMVPSDMSPINVDDALVAAGLMSERFLEVEVVLTSMRGSRPGETVVVTPRIRSIETRYECTGSIR